MKKNKTSAISKGLKPWTLMTWMWLLHLLINKTHCDCGIIKLQNSAQKFDGNYRTITGQFSPPFDKQITFYGWVRLAPNQVIKNYVLLKFINLQNNVASVTKEGKERVLQDVSGSAHEELVKISWQGPQDNFLVQYPNGPTLNTSDVLVVPNAFKGSTSWRFWALTLDYEEKRGKFFFKEYDLLDEKLHDITNITYGDLALNSDYQVILGGDPNNAELTFTGYLADVGLMTTYYDKLEFVYLINPPARTFAYRGNLLATDFSQLKLAHTTFRSWGKNSEVSQNINASLIEKLEELKTEKDSLEQFGGSGIKVSAGDSASYEHVDLSWDSGSVINTLYINLDFSFNGEFPVDFNILAYGNANSPNSFKISLVEENSELARKQFTDKRISLINLNQELPEYVYNSTLKNPRVLKLELVTSNGKLLTYLGKEIITEQEQHQITLGIIQHTPEVLRFYYSNSKKLFSLTLEHGGLPFTLEKNNLNLFSGNNSVTGGTFNMNALALHDSFFDFFLSHKYPQPYQNACYTGVDLYYFLLSNTSNKILENSNSLNINSISSSSATSFNGYSFLCDKTNGYISYQGKCLHSCPVGSFYWSNFQICKSCRQVTCVNEVTPMNMEIKVAQDENPKDKFIRLTSRAASQVYQVPLKDAGSQSPFVNANLLNLSNVPLTVTSDSLTKDVDYKVNINKSAFNSGIYESDIQIELLNPKKTANFSIEPSMPDAPEGFQFLRGDRNKAFFERKGIDVDTSFIESCSSVTSHGFILGVVFLVLYFLLVGAFVITNFLFIDNYVKWRLVMTTIGAHFIAFCVMINDHLGRFSFGFTQVIYKVLIK
jgi:hypothetical protein